VVCLWITATRVRRDEILAEEQPREQDFEPVEYSRLRVKLDSTVTVRPNTAALMSLVAHTRSRLLSFRVAYPNACIITSSICQPCLWALSNEKADWPLYDCSRSNEDLQLGYKHPGRPLHVTQLLEVFTIGLYLSVSRLKRMQLSPAAGRQETTGVGFIACIEIADFHRFLGDEEEAYSIRGRFDSDHPLSGPDHRLIGYSYCRMEQQRISHCTRCLTGH
jgi:hypothetical protein